MNLITALKQTSLNPMVVGKKLSSGLSLANYALTGQGGYGLDTGSVMWVTGEANSGRTTFGLTILAEAVINSLFNDYTLVYFDTEGKSVDVTAYLGKRVAERISIGAAYSLEQFWQYCSTAKNKIIVLDSLDGLLDSEDSWRINNTYAKCVFDAIRKNNSILIITAQEKNANYKKITAGGFAPSFYSDFHIRLSYVSDLYKTIGTKSVCIGTNTIISVIRSKYPGALRFDVPAPVFVGSGYDNAYSLFLFMVQSGRIVIRDGLYIFPDYACKGTKEEMISFFRDYESILVHDVKIDKIGKIDN